MTTQLLLPPPVVSMLMETPLATFTDRLLITSPEDAYHAIRSLFHRVDRETGVVVSLDTRHRMLAIDTISVGSVNNTFLAPREVFRTALTRGAAAIYLAHNHPSGDPTPSHDDHTITRRLAEAGKVLGITVVDHIVVGDRTFRSLARLGTI